MHRLCSKKLEIPGSAQRISRQNDKREFDESSMQLSSLVIDAAMKD